MPSEIATHASAADTEVVESDADTVAPPKRARRAVPSTVRRVALRAATYFLYDGVVTARDAARVVKVLFELAIDEAVPPPPREEMSTLRCCMENLFPCGFSSLAWFIVSRVRRKPASIGNTTARGVWTVFHRICRQALICRLFFPRGSIEYNLATLLGLVCTFFRESLFGELHRLSMWPSHFDPMQGLQSCARTLAYTVSFLLPLQRWCCVLAVPQRRNNAKKLLFAISLANARRLHSLLPTKL
jgi:hypothetical protein